MMEYVNACRMRHIHKNDRHVINKAPGSDRPRECVLHRRVCHARAHAALWAPDGLLFHGVLVGQTAAQKQRRTNGLYCGRAKKAPRLAGSRERHQAPSGSFDPERHLRTKSASTPNSCRERLSVIWVSKAVEFRPGRAAPTSGVRVLPGSPNR